MSVSGGGTPIRKTRAKKGPTKAAALKALGLTQEDLDAIKELRELREKVAEREEARQERLAAETGAPPEAIEQELHRTGEATEVSEDRQLINIGWSAAAPQAERRTDPSISAEHAPVFFARNLRGVEVRFRLSRQNTPGAKSVLLKPRGSRGDMFRLEAEDLRDSELRTQIAYDLIEIIPEGEALAAIEKQSINASHPGVRAIEQMLTNEKGQKMLTDDNREVVKTDTLPFEQQGVTVAKLNPQDNSPTGELPGKGRGIDWDKARQTDPVQKGVGQGPIVEDASPEALAAARDAVARKHGIDGPKAGGLSGMKVTVEETKRS